MDPENQFSVVNPASSNEPVNTSETKEPTSSSMLADAVHDAKQFIKAKTAGATFWTKWFWYLLLGLVGLLTIVALVVTTYLRSQKLAKALHEKDVLEEQAKQAKVDAVVAKHEEIKDNLVKEATKHEVKAGKLAETVVLVEEKEKSDKEKIAGLQSWSDIKNKVKFNKQS